MTTHFKTLMAAAAIALSAFAGAAQAQAFPAKPVSLVVPYPAGGLSDVIARSVNTTLGKHLGQPVMVENLGGASGAIAAQKVLNSPGDGYQVFQGSPNELILAPLAIASIKFKSEDFRLVQAVGAAQIAFLARKDIPANTVDELLDHWDEVGPQLEAAIPLVPPAPASQPIFLTFVRLFFLTKARLKF